MARTYKHYGAEDFFHLKRKARPEAEVTGGFCEKCNLELFPEEVELGICAECEENSGHDIISFTDQERYQALLDVSIEDQMDED